MNRKFTILIIITTILLLIFVAGGLAKDNYKWEEKFDIVDMPVWNECTGEWITFNGTWHVSDHAVEDSSGGLHLKMHDNYHLVGVGDSSGTEYVASRIWNYQINDFDLPYEFTEIIKLSLISKGKETNSIFQMRVHITLNANGEVTADFAEEKIICTGEKP